MTGITLNQNFRNNLYRFLTTRFVYHSLFWLVVLIVLTVMEIRGSDNEISFILTNNLIRLAVFVLIVYFNFNYLIPNYLNRNRIFLYLLFLIFTILIITPLENLLFYFKFSQLPERQGELLTKLNEAFLSNFLLACTSTLVKIVADWGKHIQTKQQIHTQTMQSELRFLKSQINPHFLFNTLNNLYALTLKKSDKAPEIVIKLSEMMRYMLYECNEKQVLLSKEVNYLKNYLDLESLRQGKNVRINFEVKGQVSEQMIAPLMFIPFLENSFKHGLNNQISTGFVDIILEVDDNKVRMFIENSKAPSMPKPIGRKSGGIGLVNVRRRLDLLYPDKYQLKIDDNPNTYKVSMDIDLD